MSVIIEKISKKFKVFKGRGVSAEEITLAESRLGVAFPEQYREYLQECGILSFGAHELMGLGVSGYLNVAETTESERHIGKGLPPGCIVIENMGIDGLLVVMDASGSVFSIQGESKKPLAKSFSDYLESLIA